MIQSLVTTTWHTSSLCVRALWVVCEGPAADFYTRFASLETQQKYT